MPRKTPSNEALRKADGVIDQRQQQIDPAGKDRVSSNKTGSERSQKQPGQDLRDPQSVLTMVNDPNHAKHKRRDPKQRQNAQGDHAGSAHSPEEFDVMNPQKQGLGDEIPVRRPKQED